MNARALSLPLCKVKFREVQLFVRKSRAGNECLVSTGSENAGGRPRHSTVSLWEMTHAIPVFQLFS
jgi:hypothetical protein